MTNVKKISRLPTIYSDVYIPLGIKCKPAYWLEYCGLRKFSLPFDWVGHYKLDVVIDTLNNPNKEWFVDFIEEDSKSNFYHHIKDNKTQMTSIHHFPKKYSVKEYLPIFNKMFLRRKIRLCNSIKNNQNICFIMNRNDSVKEISKFMFSLSKMYPKNHFIVINIRQDNKNNCINKYEFSRSLVLYDYLFNDVHEKGQDETKNKDCWKGNTKFWLGLMGNLKFGRNNKIRKYF